MKYKLLKMLSLLCVTASSILICACNGGSSSSGVAAGASSLSKLKLNNSIKAADIDAVWAVDSIVTENSLNASLRDMGWHLVTLTVSRVGDKISPVAVGGLIAGIYPRPAPNLGQAIEVQDINCNTAIFGKVGDSCSAYFRLKYDLSKGKNKPVLFPVQMAPKSNDLSQLLSFTAKVEPTISIAGYRFAIRAEEQYFSAIDIAAQKYRYQILLITNGDLLPINITTLQQPTNPSFQVVHRRTNNDNDPYYGSHSECSLTANSDFKQTNQLVNLLDSCIVIYQSALTSNVAKAVGELQIATDARYFFPSWGNKFQLSANYTNANPELPQTIYGSQMNIVSGNAHPSGSAMVMDSAGSLEYTAPTKNQVNAVTLDEIVRPAPSYGAQFALGQFGGTLYYDPYAGQQPLPLNYPLFVTSNASTVTQTSVTRNGEVTPNNQVYSANIDGACPVHASVRIEKGAFRNGGYANATVYYAYNGLAQTINEWVNTNVNSSARLAYQEKRSNTWTNVLIGNYTGNGCKSLGMGGGTCNVIFSSTGRFYNLGEPNPRACDQQVKINFPYPDYRNYQILSTPIAQAIAYVGNGGQSYQAVIGTTMPISYTPNYQVNGAAGNGVLLANYRLTAYPARHVKYRINLNAGDIFYQTNLGFARSEGYDLVDFSQEISNLKGTNHE